MTIGVPYNTFFKLIPNELPAFYKSFKQKQKMEDEKIWSWIGNYGISALTVAIDRCFGGKKSKAEYIKEPILSKTFENDGLTEEEVQRQRELFVAKLQVMQTNFELSKKGQ